MWTLACLVKHSSLLYNWTSYCMIHVISVFFNLCIMQSKNDGIEISHARNDFDLHMRKKIIDEIFLHLMIKRELKV